MTQQQTTSQNHLRPSIVGRKRQRQMRAPELELTKSVLAADESLMTSDTTTWHRLELNALASVLNAFETSRVANLPSNLAIDIHFRSLERRNRAPMAALRSRSGGLDQWRPRDTSEWVAALDVDKHPSSLDRTSLQHTPVSGLQAVLDRAELMLEDTGALAARLAAVRLHHG